MRPARTAYHTRQNGPLAERKPTAFVVSTQLPLLALTRSRVLLRTVRMYVETYSRAVQRGYLVLAAYITQACLVDAPFVGLFKKPSDMSASRAMVDMIGVGTQKLEKSGRRRVRDPAIVATWGLYFAGVPPIHLPQGLSHTFEDAAVRMHTALGLHCTMGFERRFMQHMKGWLSERGMSIRADVVRAVVKAFFKDPGAAGAAGDRLGTSPAIQARLTPEQVEAVRCRIHVLRARLGLAPLEQWTLEWGARSAENQELVLRFYNMLQHENTVHNAAVSRARGEAVGALAPPQVARPRAAAGAAAVPDPAIVLTSMCARAMVPPAHHLYRALPAATALVVQIDDHPTLILAVSRRLTHSSVLSPLVVRVVNVPHSASESIMAGIACMADPWAVGGPGAPPPPPLGRGAVDAGFADLRAFWHGHDPVYIATLRAYLLGLQSPAPYVQHAAQERVVCDALALSPADAAALAAFEATHPDLTVFLRTLTYFCAQAVRHHFCGDQLRVGLAVEGRVADDALLAALPLVPGYVADDASRPNAADVARAATSLANLAAAASVADVTAAAAAAVVNGLRGPAAAAAAVPAAIPPNAAQAPAAAAASAAPPAALASSRGRGRGRVRGRGGTRGSAAASAAAASAHRPSAEQVLTAAAIGGSDSDISDDSSDEEDDRGGLLVRTFNVCPQASPGMLHLAVDVNLLYAMCRVATAGPAPPANTPEAVRFAKILRLADVFMVTRSSHLHEISALVGPGHALWFAAFPAIKNVRRRMQLMPTLLTDGTTVIVLHGTNDKGLGVLATNKRAADRGEQQEIKRLISAPPAIPVHPPLPGTCLSGSWASRQGGVPRPSAAGSGSGSGAVSAPGNGAPRLRLRRDSTRQTGESADGGLDDSVGGADVRSACRRSGPDASLFDGGSSATSARSKRSRRPSSRHLHSDDDYDNVSHTESTSGRAVPFADDSDTAYQQRPPRQRKRSRLAQLAIDSPGSPTLGGCAMSDVDAASNDASALASGALGLPPCGLGSRGDVDPPYGEVIQIDDQLMPWSGVDAAGAAPSEPSGGALAGSAHPGALSGTAGGDAHAAQIRAARAGGRRLAAAAAVAAQAGEAAPVAAAAPLSVAGAGAQHAVLSVAGTTQPLADAGPPLPPAPATWPGAHRAAAGRIVGALSLTWPLLIARFGEQQGAIDATASRRLLDGPLVAAASHWRSAEPSFVAEVRDSLVAGSATDAQLRRLLGLSCVGGLQRPDPAALVLGPRLHAQLHVGLCALVARDAAPDASSSGAPSGLSATAPSWQSPLGVGQGPSEVLPAAAPLPAPPPRIALGSAIAPSTARSSALLAPAAPPPAAAARARAPAAPAAVPSARAVHRRKNRLARSTAASLAASHRGSRSLGVPRAAAVAVPPPCAAGGAAANADSSFSPDSSSAPWGPIAIVSEVSADCSSTAAQGHRQPPRFFSSTASAAMHDGEEQRPSCAPNAATIAAAAAHLAETAATRAAFKAAHPNTVIASCDTGCKDLNSWAILFPNDDWAYMKLSNAEYYALRKVDQWQLKRRHWKRQEPAVGAALTDLSLHSSKTSSPAALRAHIQCVERTNGVLWPHAAKPRNAQLRFAIYSAARKCLARFFQRLWETATHGGKFQLMVAWGDGKFSATGRGRKGGAPTTALEVFARECLCRPGVTFDETPEHRTSLLSFESKHQLANVHETRDNHWLEKRARKEARASRRVARAAHAALAFAPPAPPPPCRCCW